MLILAKSIMAMMVGFVLSVLFGLVAIPFLKKINVRQNLSTYLGKTHSKKAGTPTMGGIIFIIPTIISVFILMAFNKLEITENLAIILFVFLSYALLGFIDDYLIIKRHNNIGLTEFQKLAGQLFIALIFFFVYMKSGSSPTLEVTSLNININLGWVYGIFILFMLVASSNAFNITDGLDGLAGGLSLVAYLAFALICWGSTAISGSSDIAIFCFILVGSLMGFLVYNFHPAKVFMGDTGSLSLGATLASIAIITKHEMSFIFVCGVFIFETLVCVLQIISMVYFHKKLFLMTPFHHHLEKMGWQETDIVRLFLVIGMILSMGAITYGVWI